MLTFIIMCIHDSVFAGITVSPEAITLREAEPVGIPVTEVGE